MASNPPSSKKGRKFHHKSRYGCLPCKQRRIKCDEKKPTCGNCVQRCVECSFKYYEPAPTSQQLITTTISDTTRPLMPAIPLQPTQSIPDLSFCRSNTRDLELYCHFQMYTSPSFSDQISIQNVFREGFMNLAGSFRFVGHGLLSIAYIHLATLSPASSAKLLTEGAFHLNHALPGYLETIKDITEENSAALFGFAMFVVIFTFADVNEECGVLLHTARHDPSKKTEAIKNLARSAARVAHSMHNIFGIFWRCQRWIASGPLAAAIQRYSPPVLNEYSMRWIKLEGERLALLRNLWEHDPSISMAQEGVLSDSLNSLRDTFAMVTQLTAVAISNGNGEHEPSSIDLSEIHKQLFSGRLDDVQSVFTWYIRLSPGFITMIADGNMYAMVVLAHYAIVLDRACSDKWWLHQLPQRFVAVAQLILGEERKGWIEWPLLVVTTEGGNRGHYTT
ncbi:hypothetical protein BDV12DRAFT_189830 [Aspergillus spectabilis]